ncbi:MAG: prenyltransferase [Candidatus Omnitrophota bacterium]|jgi:1,4-dihydroxy-2-naphthoate octaprenyltransferase
MAKASRSKIRMLNFIRALRLPFITASFFPYLAGALLAKPHFNALGFFLGLITVISTHLSANLLNDFADSKSGNDWQDKTFYSFFGGSKLIQESIFSERFYLYAALIFSFVACVCVFALAVALKSVLVLWLFFVILILAWGYSAQPVKLSYRKWGEVVIFVLFGPVCVMGGYFIQSGVFPAFKSFLLSLPFGFLTTAILFANEVPDYSDDLAVGKYTWVSFMGQEHAFWVYSALIACALVCVGINIMRGFLSPFAWVSLATLIPALKAARILKGSARDKPRFVESSKLTIAIHTLVSMAVLLGLIVKR